MRLRMRRMDTIPEVEKKIEQLKRKQSRVRTQGERQYWRALIGQWQRHLVELKGRQSGENIPLSQHNERNPRL